MRSSLYYKKLKSKQNKSSLPEISPDDSLQCFAPSSETPSSETSLFIAKKIVALNTLRDVLFEAACNSEDMTKMKSVILSIHECIFTLGLDIQHINSLTNNSLTNSSAVVNTIQESDIFNTHNISSDDELISSSSNNVTYDQDYNETT